MLNLKKLIASVSAVALVLTSVATSAFAATYTDVAEDSAYFEAVEALGKLGIVEGFEDGTYKPENEVTRAQMAAFIARIQGFGETAKAQVPTQFTDVTADHWASGYIAQAANQGIVNGYGGGKFGPDDKVKYEQAVKMIMCTLGYEPFAANNGGYPTGYLTAATRYNVTKGVSNAVVGSNANRGTIAQLLNNAIDTPLMAQYKWNTDGTVEYLIYDGTDAAYKTLMSENLSTVKLRGVVVENPYISLTNSKTIATDKDAEVKIVLTSSFDTSNDSFKASSDLAGNVYYGDYGLNAEVPFLVGATDAADYLGQSVIFYVQETAKDDWEIQSIALDSARNEAITFGLDQYYTYTDASSKLTTIEYYKNSTDNTTTKATIDENAKFVLNNHNVTYSNYGVLFGNANTADADDTIVDFNGKTLEGGQVTLINNDGDTKFDIVMVEIASVGVVEEVTEDMISFKNGAVVYTEADAAGEEISEIEIDEEDYTKAVVILKDGEEISFADLQEWDVLSILTYGDKSDYIVAEVLSNPVVGSVTATKSSKASDGGVAYKIDGTTYDVAKGAYGVSGIEVGDGGTFYIDKYGKIAALNEDSSLATGIAGNYGYIFNIDVIAGDFGDDVLSMQIVTEEGLQTLDVNSNAKIKGDLGDGDDTSSKQIKYATTATGNTLAINYADRGNAGSDTKTVIDALKDSVVKFSKNSNGKVTEIVLPEYTTGSAATKLEDKLPGGATTGAYDADNNKLGAFYGDADAVVFFVDTVDFDKCEVGTLADLTDKESYTIRAVLADNKADDNNVFVVEGSATKAGLTTNWAVITEVSSGTVEGNSILTLSYVTNGELVENVDTVAWEDVKTTATADDVTVGDIVKIKTNGAGKIAALTMVVDYDFDTNGVGAFVDLPYDTDTVASSTETIVGGVVRGYAKNQDVATFSTGVVNDNGTAGDTSDDYLETVSYKLSKAENVYVIDTTGRDIEVKRGSASSFRYIEKLYAGTGSIKLNGVTVALDGDSEFASTAFKAGTDKVYVREYDNRVTDVVIVKVEKPEVEVVTAGSGSGSGSN